MYEVDEIADYGEKWLEAERDLAIHCWREDMYIFRILFLVANLISGPSSWVTVAGHLNGSSGKMIFVHRVVISETSPMMAFPLK